MATRSGATPAQELRDANIRLTVMVLAQNKELRALNKAIKRKVEQNRRLRQLLNEYRDGKRP